MHRAAGNALTVPAAIGEGSLKYDEIVQATDIAPASFVRSLALCLIAGAACWGALFAVLA
jgi:hypothetical protein